MQASTNTASKVVDHPRAIRFDRRDYAWTGKIERRAGFPAVWIIELEAPDKTRVWVDQEGNVYPEGLMHDR